MMKRIGLIALTLNLALVSAALAGGYENGSGYGGSSGASSGSSTTCSGDINPACSQVTAGSHLGAATVPNSALATNPLNASNISSGTLPAAQLPAFTGDATSTAGSSATTNKNAHWTVTIVTSAGTPYTVLSTDNHVFCNGTGTIAIDLPSATGSGRAITVGEEGTTASNCRVVPQSGEKINAFTAGQYLLLNEGNQAVTVVDAASGQWVTESNSTATLLQFSSGNGSTSPFISTATGNFVLSGGALVLSAQLELQQFTVSTLPATCTKGFMVEVTDATTINPTGGTCTGSGGSAIPAICSATNTWSCL